MTPQYKKYLSEMKRLKATPPFMSERDLLDSLGIKTEYKMERIVPKQNHHKKAASLEMFIKNAESKKRKKPTKIGETSPKMSDEERAIKRKEYSRAKKERLKAIGLTTKGTPPKPRKEGMTAREKIKYEVEKNREQRAIWKEQGLNSRGQPFAKDDKKRQTENSKRYQQKNREKHLANRKAWREKNKERLNAERRIPKDRL